jgi:hypothetical protein
MIGGCLEMSEMELLTGAPPSVARTEADCGIKSLQGSKVRCFG